MVLTITARFADIICRDQRTTKPDFQFLFGLCQVPKGLGGGCWDLF